MRNPAPEPPPTLLESALRFNRTAAMTLVILLPLVSWMWIVAMARDMNGPMTGPSAWMMTAVWDVWHLALLWAMWAVMMAAMMMPSASPMLLLYGAAARRSASSSAASRQIYAFAGGYLVVWTAFSLGAAALQRVLSAWFVLSPMMEVTSHVASAALLLIAGVYQLTPLKNVCLRGCRSPLAFLMSQWRQGVAGALRMGVQHGAMCVGCCWALMLLLFAGGVMNLTVIGALTALVAFEKLAPFGAQSARVSGLVLIASALWVWARGAGL